MKLSSGSILQKQSSERGQGVAEYALVVVLVAIALVVVLILLGEDLSGVYCSIANKLGADSCEVTESTAYCEEALNNSKGWEFTRKGDNYWDVSDGKMCVIHDTFRDYAFNTCSQDLPSDDYIIRMSGVDLTAGPGYGVFFRLQDVSETPSGYAFQYDAGAHGFVFRKWTNGAEKTLAYRSRKDYEFYDVPRDIEVHVEGDTFSAYVDGNLVLTTSDSTYPTGDAGIGLRTWWDTRLCFTGLTLEPIETN